MQRKLFHLLQLLTFGSRLQCHCPAISCSIYFVSLSNTIEYRTSTSGCCRAKDTARISSATPSVSMINLRFDDIDYLMNTKMKSW